LLDSIVPNGSDSAYGEEAADDEKGLHRHARVLTQPTDQGRRQRVGVVGHGSVEGQVMQDDQLTGQGLQRVDEGKP
jgi:hypothetical protein